MTTVPPARARDVPVFVDAGQRRRVMGATDWWFYPLVILGAVGLILLSLGADVFVKPAIAQRAAREGPALVYNAHLLARGSQSDGSHVRFVVRDFGMSARAVRFAVRPNIPPPTAEDRGVQLLLDSADGALLAGKPVDVELVTRRFAISAAGGIALSLQNGGPVTWVTVPLPAQSGPLTVRLNAPEGAAPTALGVRMLSEGDDMNYGVEISRITLRPAS
jgi:hypothetical protein